MYDLPNYSLAELHLQCEIVWCVIAASVVSCYILAEFHLKCAVIYGIMPWMNSIGHRHHTSCEIRMAKTHRMSQVAGHFSQKSH